MAGKKVSKKSTKLRFKQIKPTKARLSWKNRVDLWSRSIANRLKLVKLKLSSLDNVASQILLAVALKHTASATDEHSGLVLLWHTGRRTEYPTGWQYRSSRETWSKDLVEIIFENQHCWSSGIDFWTLKGLESLCAWPSQLVTHAAVLDFSKIVKIMKFFVHDLITGAHLCVWEREKAS